MIFWHTKISLNPKDTSISKIDRVSRIFLSRVEAKSSFYQIFKSQNIIQFLRFGLYFLHVCSFSIEVQPLNSNLRSYTTPSLCRGRGTGALRGLKEKRATKCSALKTNIFCSCRSPKLEPEGTFVMVIFFVSFKV